VSLPWWHDDGVSLAGSDSDEFIVAACVPRDDHASGTLEAADAIREADPRLAAGDIYAAAVVGVFAEVERLLGADRARETARGGPYKWDALTYLCFSRYLQLRPSRGFVRAARALLDAGADPNTGFFESAHQPEPVFESVLYGAAGVAHHAELTRLLLVRGADPNRGGEVAYHAPEGFDAEAMQAVVESGRLSPAGLTTMLHRKPDWTDLEGVRWLLEHGVDPNALSAWGDRALHHSLDRDNALPLPEALLDFGAGPTLTARAREDRSAVAMAARCGRADALELSAQLSCELRAVIKRHDNPMIHRVRLQRSGDEGRGGCSVTDAAVRRGAPRMLATRPEHQRG
jgi:hypothetical protein